MILRRLRASFGCLAGTELALHEGLNILEAANESGKSTWCAFIRCMLFGVDSAGRRRGDTPPDKQLYAPWSGAPMEGELELSFAGEELLLRRTTALPAAPMREFSAVYAATGETVPLFTSRDAGETLVGAGEDVFERTAFIRGDAMAVRGGAELERRISAVLTSGGEEGSYSEAEARLRAWQRQRRFRGKGRLPELETELAAVNARLHETERAAEALAAMEQDRERLERERERLRREAALAQQERRAELLRALEAAREESAAREGEAARAQDEAERRREALDASPYAAADEELIGELAEDCARELRLGERKNTWFFVLAALFALAAAAAGVFSGLAAAALAVAAALALCAALLRRAYARERIKAARHTLARYDAASPEALRESWAAYQNALAALQVWDDETETRRASAAEARRRLREREAAIFALPEREEPEALRRVDAQLAQRIETCAMARGELGARGDPLVLRSRALTLEEERAREERAVQALELAWEGLRDAERELQSDFTPALTARTAELMARLTGGRYSELSLSRELDALLRRGDEPVMHESAFLSRGTGDQLYLALRLALSELALDGAERCPLILDDALAAFDDERLGLALELLEELGRERQILLFTCQSRETRYFRRREKRKG